jgi:hypothetical protein
LLSGGGFYGLSLIGLVIFGGVGCYAYCPPASEVFEEIRIANGETLSAEFPVRDELRLG